MMRSAVLCPLFLALTACSAGGESGGAGGRPRLSVHYLVPPGPHASPFEGVTDYRVTIRDASGIVVSEDFEAGEPMRLTGLEPAAGLTLELEGFDGGSARISHGRTLAFDLVEADADVWLYFARSNTFNDVNGGYVPRVAPAVMGLSDGRVVIAGGTAAGTPVGDTDLYDPAIDALAAGPAMPHPRSFPGVAAIGPDTLLVAGGASPANAPSADADLFLWDAIAEQGSWAAIPPMSVARRDTAAAPLGGMRALLVTGSSGTGLVSSAEVFEWTGSVGSWSAAANDAGKPRKGAVAIPAGDGRAIVAGGWSADDGGRAEKESRLFAVNSTGGGFVGLPGGGLEEERAWPAIVELAPGEWLLAGGIGRDEEEAFAFGGSPELLSTAERLVWDGASSTHVSAGNGGAPRRRGGGGVLADGRVLLLGGDLTSNAGQYDPAALDQALVFTEPASFSSLGASAGATSCAAVVPLADGTTLVVTDGGVMRYNPP